MRYSLITAVLATTFLSSLASAVTLELDLEPSRTQKIIQKRNEARGENPGFYEIQDLDVPYYEKKVISDTYDDKKHSITIENITEAYLKERAKQINFQPIGEKLSFEFKVVTTLYRTGKCEEEPSYRYIFKAEIPLAKLGKEGEVIKLSPEAIEYQAPHHNCLVTPAAQTIYTKK